MMDDKSVFPSIGDFAFPPCCPPEDAIDADGVAYRIVRNDPPTPEDFKTHHEMGKKPSPRSTAAQKCNFCAVSVYRNLADARNHLQKYPGGGKFIAVGVLRGSTGKTKLAPNPDRPTHSNWWCFEECDCQVRVRLFKIYPLEAETE